MVLPLTVNSFARVAGSLAPVITLGGILLATMLDPTFSWLHHALSDLGVRDESALVFNGSLVLGGLLGGIYGIGVTSDSTSSTSRSVGIIFTVASIGLVGVGVFVIGHPLHGPAAVGFYFLVTLAFLIDGVRRRTERTGQWALVLVAIHVIIWASWWAGLWPGTGLALPEFAGALLLPMWMWFVGPRPTVRSSGRIGQ